MEKAEEGSARALREATAAIYYAAATAALAPTYIGPPPAAAAGADLPRARPRAAILPEICYKRSDG